MVQVVTPLPAPFDPTLRYAEVNGHRIAYTDDGVGPAVLTIHGLPGSHRDWRYLGAALRDSCRVVRFVLPGFGDSPSIKPPLSARAQARLVADFITKLGLDSPVVIGHSAGGAVALALAEAMGTRLGGLGLVSSVGLRPHKRAPGPLVHGLLYLLQRPQTRTPVTVVVRHMYRLMGFPSRLTDQERLEALEQASRIHYPWLAEAAKRLQVPTLLAWTRDDPFIEDAIFNELADACPRGPRLVFQRGGHNPQKTHCVALAEALITMMTTHDEA